METKVKRVADGSNCAEICTIKIDNHEFTAMGASVWGDNHVKLRGILYVFNDEDKAINKSLGTIKKRETFLTSWDGKIKIFATIGSTWKSNFRDYHGFAQENRRYYFTIYGRKCLGVNYNRQWQQIVRFKEICRGFQMLGNVVKDPYGVEGSRRAKKGLGLLSMETRFLRRKATFQVEAEDTMGGRDGGCFNERLMGYEIHAGQTVLRGERSLFRIRKRSGKACRCRDGAVSRDGRIWGTYIHGLFDKDRFRRRFIEGLQRDGVETDAGSTLQYAAFKEEQLDRLADLVARRLICAMCKGLSARHEPPAPASRAITL